MGRMGVCFVLTLVQYKVSQFFSFFGLFLYLFKNQNISYNKNVPVEGAKSNHLHSRRIEIRLQKIHTQKCHLQNWGFFACVISVERSAKGPKKITERCFSCQNKSVCQKLARSCKKWKSAQNLIYALFAQRPSIRLVFLSVRFQKIVLLPFSPDI